MNGQKRIKLRTNNIMPVIGLGTWQMGDNATQSILNALRFGYRMIDTSGSYGTQEAVGEALRRSKLDRDAVYIITKVEKDEDSYKATKSNLQELDLDYADLVLIHWPPEFDAGQDLWQGLMRAKRDGLTRDIGVSNYSINQIEELITDTKEVPAVNQIEWSPFGHSSEIYDYCRENDILIQAYSPLTQNEKLDNETLGKIALKYNKSPQQIVLRWNIQLGIVPLPKASKAAHQKENIEVFDFEINPDDMLALHNLNEQYSALFSELQYI